MDAKDVLKIITKQWCDSDDFKSLSQLGDNALCKLKKELIKPVNSTKMTGRAGLQGEENIYSYPP